MDINQALAFLYSNPYTLFLIATWTVVWKGTALWKAARKESKFWFIILLLVNTIGLLEIAYIFFLNRIDFGKYFKKLDLSHLLGSLKKDKIK